MPEPGDESVRDAREAVEPPFDESAENALRYFGLEVHNVERIRDQLALMFVYVDDDSTYSWETRDALHTGLIYAYEAAIRASERAKVEALVEVAEDALVYFDLKPHDAAWKKARFRSALDAVRAGRGK